MQNLMIKRGTLETGAIGFMATPHLYQLGLGAHNARSCRLHLANKRLCGAGSRHAGRFPRLLEPSNQEPQKCNEIGENQDDIDQYLIVNTLNFLYRSWIELIIQKNNNTSIWFFSILITKPEREYLSDISSP